MSLTKATPTEGWPVRSRYASLAMLACSVIWMPDGYERTAAVLAAAAAAGGLQFVIGLFLRYEFNHADND